jgi:hypothetical protein
MIGGKRGGKGRYKVSETSDLSSKTRTPCSVKQIGLVLSNEKIEERILG